MSDNTNNTHLNDTGATCYKCDEPVPLLYLHGKNDPLDETWVYCAHTGWYCPSHSQTSNCGDTECVGCNPAWFFNKGEDSKEDKEDKEDEESESESEDEPEGECCAGATDPRIVITYTMAGGGAHWENWEVHYDIADGEQKELYINNITGHHREYGMKLFYHEDETDQLRIEAKDFEHEDWHEMVHYN